MVPCEMELINFMKTTIFFFWSPMLLVSALQIQTGRLIRNLETSITSAVHSTDTFCEYYNRSCIENAILDPTSRVNECYGQQKCDLNHDESHSCLVTWKQINVTDSIRVIATNEEYRHSSGHDVILMGCLPSIQKGNCDQNACVENRSEHNVIKLRFGVLFCCCNGNMCNENFTWTPNNTIVANKADKREDSSLLFYLVIPVILVAISLILLLYYKYKNGKSPPFNHLHNNVINGRLDRNSGDVESFLLNPLEDISLTVIKARGRFEVWKGRKHVEDIETEVAVKVFPMNEQNSWIAEQEIYKLLKKEHPNILKFLNVHIHSNLNLTTDFWLITEFHEKGSLFDFLTNNVVSWDDLCKIAYGMSCGLNHLHEEIHMGNKPSIAHRDIKSKNVLIKHDLTPCLADFGLALVFEPGKPIGDTYPQVGTRRYMAPEILEGAIIFSRDQFFRIDIYACGLVLWELVSQCITVWNYDNNTQAVETHHINNDDHINYNTSEDRVTQTYKLPFEAEAGISNPTLEQMQDLVVNQRIRPYIKESWGHHSGMAQIIRTIKECWDQDAEARISASCVMERIQNIRHETLGSPNPISTFEHSENET